MSSAHTSYGGPRFLAAQVAVSVWAQQCLLEAHCRLRSVYEGRLKTALPGVSHQYLSQVCAGKVPCSLARFVQLLAPLTRAEREIVLGAWLDGARMPDGPPLVEVAEATEAAGEALACAQRILAASAVTPRELEDLKRKVHKAERELEDVNQAIGRAK